ncbi:MAG: histidine kinase N-terminal 7TM domain-containing protein, partial [Anaerolineales bacterium]|nr:histidine kinase N-terminal 7TM domain-containing protein [Anaerolineales bacterium]
MSSTSIHYLIPVILLLVAVLYASLGLVAWRRRPALAVTPFAWLMLAMGEWSLGYALEFLAPGLAAKTLLAKVEYFGIVSLPVFWLAFALEYTGRRSWLTWRNWAALWLIPLLTLGLAWTNDWHGLIWKQVWIDTTGKFPVWMSVHGAWFWAFTAYSYLLLLAGTLLVGWEMVRTPALYRSQAGVILLGAISPWAGNAIYLSGASPLPGLDLTPFAFIPTGLALLWGITRYGLLEIVPPAHDVILQHLHDGVLVVDWRGRTLYLNPVAERIFNLSADQAIGQPVQEFFPSYPELMVGQPGEEERRVELPLAVEGKSRFFDVHISPVYTSARRRKPDRVGAVRSTYSAQKPSHLVLFYDIQQRKQAETALKHRDAILQAVSLAAEKFLRMEAWEQSTPEVLEQLGRAAEASRVYIFERHLTEDGTPLVSQRYEWVAAGIAAQIDNPDLQNLAYRAAGFERWDEAFMQRQAVFGLVGDFPKAEKELLSVQDILSIAVMPIFAEEEYWGFIGFDECHFERVWTNTELEALRAAADIFGAALARNRAEAILHNRRRSLNLLHEIIHEALQTPDLQSMTQALVDRLGELIGADGCFLTLWDEKARKVVPMAAYGPFRDTYRSLVIGSGEKTFTTSVLEAGHPLVIEDAFHSSYISPRLAAKFSACSMLALPLIAGENKLGAILLGFNSPHHFSEDEIDLGEQAAGLIALTLAKFRAVEQAYQRAEESETLRKAGSLVAATLDPQEAVSRILEQLEQVVPHDSASVQLLRDGELEIVGGRGWPEPASVIGIRFPVPGDNPNSIVIQTRQPYVLDETDKVYPTFRRPPHSHIRSWLGVPLIVRNEVTGILAIDSTEPHHFNASHVQLAAAFADQVAITLENTRLFGSAQQQAKRQALLLQLSTDLAVALNEQDICKRTVHNLHDMLGFDYVSVFLVDEDSGDRVLQVGMGLPDQLIPERMPPGRGLSERPLLDGQLHYTPEVRQESNYIPGNNGSE